MYPQHASLAAQTRLFIVLASIFALFLLHAPAQAQTAETFGDDFIYFVENTNVAVDAVTDGSVVVDPLSPGSGNQVMEFRNGNYTYPGFRRGALDVGIDMTANVNITPGLGDTLFMRILSDPSNDGRDLWSVPNRARRIEFQDKTNDVYPSSEDRDFPFRLGWVIPSWVHDGQWHDLAIPLPPTTVAALDSARVNKHVDGTPLAVPFDTLAAKWYYGGAWTKMGFGVGVPSTNTPAVFGGNRLDLFREFEWSNVAQFGPIFDWGDAGSTGAPIYIDDLYLGGPGVDLGPAASPPPVLSGINGSASGDTYTVTWPADDTVYGAYNVYYSPNPITDISAADVQLLEVISSAENRNSASLRAQAPHPTLAQNQTIYFAVTGTSYFGLENTSVGSNTTSATSTVTFKPFIFELSTAEADAILADLNATLVRKDNFPGTSLPFAIKEGQATVTDAPTQPGSDQDADLSLEALIGYHAGTNTIYIYSEVTDDQLSFEAEGQNGSDAWRMDSIAITWGLYEPISSLLGSTHDRINTGSTASRGAEPDYHFRFAPFGSSSTPDSPTGDGVVYEIFSGVGEVSDAQMAVAIHTDEASTPVGWKMLAQLPLTPVQQAGNDDAFVFPTDEQLKLAVMHIGYNDNDSPGSRTRDHEIVWSPGPAKNVDWWNSPTQWEVVAFAGAESALPVELTHFDVLGQGDTALLQWETVQETNNAGFEVEYRSHASDASGRFVALGFVEGQGTTLAAHQYTYTSPELPPGTYTFRLKQVDYDGQFAYSPEVTLTLDLKHVYQLTAPYPNPMRAGGSQSTLTVATSQQASVRIYDILGREVALLFAGQLTGNQPYHLRLDLQDLASGLYVLRAEGETFRAQQTFTLQR